MNYLEKIEIIKSKLKEINYESIADRILELQLSGGTGGEVLISVCSVLLRIRREQNQVFKYIESEANELNEYANSIGLYPE